MEAPIRHKSLTTKSIIVVYHCSISFNIIKKQKNESKLLSVVLKLKIEPVNCRKNMKLTCLKFTLFETKS